VDFLADVSPFLPLVTAYWTEMDAESFKWHVKGPKCPYSLMGQIK
jgi:hypothetical protein